MKTCLLQPKYACYSFGEKKVEEDIGIFLKKIVTYNTMIFVIDKNGSRSGCSRIISYNGPKKPCWVSSEQCG